MDSFFATLSAVAMMLGYASIGYVMIKCKLLKEEAGPVFAKFLLYVSSPCLTIYTITDIACTSETLKDAGILFAFSMIFQVSLLLLFRFIYRKHKDDVNYRIHNIASCLGNVGFMCVPLLEIVMPEYPEAVLLSTIYCQTMSFIAWTLVSYIISNDKKYMSVKSALLNPSSIAFFVALPLFIFNIQIPSGIDTMVTLLGKMSAPLCMLIMGIRLGTMKFKSLFEDKRIFLTIGLKQLVMPLVAYVILLLLPVSNEFRMAVFILASAPIASMVLNYAELIGQGQKKAANLVLLGTLLSIVTMPVMVLVMYH